MLSACGLPDRSCSRRGLDLGCDCRGRNRKSQSQSSRAGFAIISVDAGVAVGDDRRESNDFGKRTLAGCPAHAACSTSERIMDYVCTTLWQWQWPVSCSG